MQKVCRALIFHFSCKLDLEGGQGKHFRALALVDTVFTSVRDEDCALPVGELWGQGREGLFLLENALKITQSPHGES